MPLFSILFLLPLRRAFGSATYDSINVVGKNRVKKGDYDLIQTLNHCTSPTRQAVRRMHSNVAGKMNLMSYSFIGTEPRVLYALLRRFFSRQILLPFFPSSKF